jgi:hypothetical protein
VKRWRVGSRIPINVYDGNRPVCQCHSKEDAAKIVLAVNFLNGARGPKERKRKGE